MSRLLIASSGDMRKTCMGRFRMISDARERQPIGSEHPFRPWLQDSLSVCFGTVRVSANSHENPYYTYLQLLWDHHVNLSVISQKSLHEREVGKQGTSWKYSMTCRVLDSVLDSAATLTTAHGPERNAVDIRVTSDRAGGSFRCRGGVGCFLQPREGGVGVEVFGVGQSSTSS